MSERHVDRIIKHFPDTLPGTMAAPMEQVDAIVTSIRTAIEDLAFTVWNENERVKVLALGKKVDALAKLSEYQAKLGILPDLGDSSRPANSPVSSSNTSVGSTSTEPGCRPGKSR